MKGGLFFLPLKGERQRQTLTGPKSLTVWLKLPDGTREKGQYFRKNRGVKGGLFFLPLKGERQRQTLTGPKSLTVWLKLPDGTRDCQDRAQEKNRKEKL